jgi:hypothetical protein
MSDDYKAIGTGSLQSNGIELIDVTATYDRMHRDTVEDKESRLSEEENTDDENIESSPLLKETEGYNAINDTKSLLPSLNQVNFQCQPGDFIAIGTF